MALVTQTTVAGLTGGTSAAVDTTGAKFIAVAVAYNTGGTPTVSDNKGNTYTGRTARDSGVDSAVQIFDVLAPTVGTGHTFTIAGGTLAQAAVIMAFDDDVLPSSAFDQENGSAGAGGTSRSCGSVTPTENGELLIAALGIAQTKTVSIDNSASIAAQVGFSGGNNYGVAGGYLVQGTAAAITLTWSWSGDITPQGSAGAVATYKVVQPLASGTAQLDDATNTTLSVSVGNPSGGLAPYTYQWYRSETADFTPGGGNLVSGATSQTLNDSTGLSANTPYYYICRVTDDNSDTADSNQIAGILKAAPLVVYALGDSITKGTEGPSPASSTPPEAMAVILQKLYQQRDVTVVNGGVDAASAEDFALDTGDILTDAVAAAVSAGADLVSLMLGANDAADGRTASEFGDDLETIVAAFAVESIPVMVHYPTYIPAGANGGATDEAATELTRQYLAEIDSLINGTTILQGDTVAYAWFIDHQDEVQSDETHLLETGVQSLAIMQSRAIDRFVLNVASGSAFTGIIGG